MPSSALEAVASITHDFAVIHRAGCVVAYIEWAWVGCEADCWRVDNGEIVEGGEVLYISLLSITDKNPTLIWQLKRRVPKFRYIVWFDDRTGKDFVVAPKGLPETWT